MEEDSPPPEESPKRIRKISIHNLTDRRQEIAKQVIEAADDTGFFILVNQDYPSSREIKEVFEISRAFFALPTEAKARTPLRASDSSGWKSQLDLKESLHLQYHRRSDASWPDDGALPPELKEKLVDFMEKAHRLSMQLLSMFADALNYPTEYFSMAHQVTKNDAQSTLRLLHYLDASGLKSEPNRWRTRPHTDPDCLTLLFQRSGEPGLEVCPGAEAQSGFAPDDHWMPIRPITGEILCNVGDMLTSWSDGRFKSLFHRVRYPGNDESRTERFSISYFNQPNKKVVVQGPLRNYVPMTAQEYVNSVLYRHFTVG